jgi:hypothetical protein
MGSSVPKSAAEIMQRLFEVVLDEARTHPDFAERLLKALPFDAVARIDFKPDEASRKTPAPRNARTRTRTGAFDPNAFSLVANLKTLGELGLRKKLKAFSPKQLQSIVAEQRLDVDEKVFRNKKRATREMIDAIMLALHARVAGSIAAAS